MESRRLLTTYQVVSTSDDGSVGTLRWAILQVNQDQTLDTIDFDIDGTGVQTIQLSQALPALTNSVLIDGTSQTPGSATPTIQLDGSKLPTASNGLILSGGSSTIRGLAINGFSGSAIVLKAGDANVVAGNFLGTDATGLRARSNGVGISILGSSKNTIGGTTASAANLISGNLGSGISISTYASVLSSKNVIQGNFIGTDLSGTVPIGNRNDGIYLADSASNTIGGTTAGSTNVISANFGNGIDAQGTSNLLVIQGNAIGTDSTGAINLGNQSNGIYLLSSQNMIGGLDVAAGNLIANNGTGSVGTGIQLGNSAGQNSFLSNSIYGNHKLGINLGNGPTPNDYQDKDTGGNGLQNYPTLTLAQGDGVTTTVQGSLNSAPNTTFLIQFFSSPSVDSSGFGPGKYYIGSTSVTTDKDGNVTFTAPGFDPSKGTFLTATATDPDGNTSEFSHAIAIQTVADLSITVSASEDTVHVGEGLIYTITVTNKSVVAASSVQITDTLAISLTVQSLASSQGGAPASFGNVVSANLGTLAGGASASFTITVQPQAGALGSIVNSATVSSQSTDPDLSNNSSSTSTTVRAAADLSMTIAPDADSVPMEGNSTFTVTISNEGPSLAHNVVLRIPLDSSSNFVSISSATPPVVGSDGSITVNLGSLASGSSLSLKLVLKAVSMSGLVVNSGVSSDDDDLNSTNDTATLTEPVTAATDLSLSITAGQNPAYRGLNLVYTIIVHNNGPCDATTVVVNQSLPEGTTFVSATSDTGSAPTVDGSVLTGLIGDLKSGATATLTIVVKPNVDSSDSIHSAASVSSDLAEINPDNNSASLQTSISNASDLSVAVTSGPTSAIVVGQGVTYVLTVTNQGPSDDPGVQFQDLLPIGLSLVSATSAQGSPPTFAAGKLTANLGPLRSGQRTTVTITAMPTIGIPGGLSSIASVQGTNDDLDSSNNVVTSILNVAPVNLSTQLVASQSQIQTGDTLTLTATIRNLGNTLATGVSFSLPIGSLVQCISTSSSLGTTSLRGNVVVAALGNLEAGAVATVTIQVRAVANGSMTSTMFVTADEVNTDPGQGIASVTSLIQESAGIIAFASNTGQVLQSAGYAMLPVVRSWGTAGTVTVFYQTVAGSAVAGRDFVPISGTLTFLPGQTSQYIQVPVLAAPHAQSDYTLSLVLSAATAGAVLGPQQTTLLTIQDPSPDTIPPQVTDLRLSGPGKTITSLSFTFSEAIGADSASDLQAFRLINLGPDGQIGTGDDQQIAIYAPFYDAMQHVVTINLVNPLPSNHYFGIQIAGSGPDAIHDLAGNLLDGAATGLSGTAYAALFARGTNLAYKDSQGNSVNLRLKGPGFIDQIRNANGDGLELTLQNAVQGRSSLSGTVKRGRTGSGSTEIGTIDGLGTFGQVRVKLASPAFIVRSYPFQQSSRNQPIAAHTAKAKVKQAKPKILARHPKIAHPR